MNAGEEGAVIVGELLKADRPEHGFNAATGEYCDMVEAGIVDPTKVSMYHGYCIQPELYLKKCYLINLDRVLVSSPFVRVWKFNDFFIVSMLLVGILSYVLACRASFHEHNANKRCPLT